MSATLVALGLTLLGVAIGVLGAFWRVREAFRKASLIRKANPDPAPDELAHRLTRLEHKVDHLEAERALREAELNDLRTKWSALTKRLASRVDRALVGDIQPERNHTGDDRPERPGVLSFLPPKR